jgi:hypothetical protein
MLAGANMSCTCTQPINHVWACRGAGEHVASQYQPQQLLWLLAPPLLGGRERERREHAGEDRSAMNKQHSAGQVYLYTRGAALEALTRWSDLTC